VLDHTRSFPPRCRRAAPRHAAPPKKTQHLPNNKTKTKQTKNLIEKIVRTRIYESSYWKEHCFGLSAELLVDKAVALRAVGGMFGEPQRPTHFLCLVLKMLQIGPDKEIVVELIRNEEYKYVRLLGESERASLSV
jgi:hypothetical protein